MIITIGFFVCPMDASYASEKQIKKIESKIKELKYKEKLEIKKLSRAQKRLESTKKSIKSCENELWKSRVNISNLNSKLECLQREQDLIAQKAGKRIREIYKGERVNLLHLLFASENLGTFLDRMYYQQRMAKKDKDLLESLKNKSSEIIRSQRAVEYEKRNVSSTLRRMNNKKSVLNNAIQTSNYMINKLRTDRAAYEQAQKELAHLSKNIEKTLIKTIKTHDIIKGPFLKPVVGYISSPYGWRTHPIFKSRKFHSGIDIAGPNRSPIKASNSGKVVHSGWYGGYGKVVIISHGIKEGGSYSGKKISTLYAHMSRTVVRVGNYVKKGQVIGYEGSTGYSTGPHLHFEVRVDGKTANPMGFIKR